MARLVLLPVLGALGCAPGEITCTSLAVGPDNFVQPFEVALDPVRRRAYVTALGTPNVAEVDLDARALVGVHAVGDEESTPDIVVDAAGIAWVARPAAPAVTRLDPATGARRTIEGTVEQGRDIVAAAGGGAVVLGEGEGERSRVAVLGPDGSVAADVWVDAYVTGLVSIDGGARVGLLADTGLELVGVPTLEHAAWCEVGFHATHGAQLADGRIVVTDDEHVGVAGCDGAEAVVTVVGVENRDVVPLAEGALVLDRVGSGEGADPNLGLARRLGPEGLDDAGFPTGKNTGFGAFDPVSGLVWANSEGSTELLAIDPSTGAIVDRVRLGTFLDGLAPDPEDPDAVYVTGRLSDTWARVDAAGVRAATTPTWPYAPVVDVGRGLVWSVSQTDMHLVAHTRDLALERDIDLGLGPNATLTFGALALDEARGTVLVAHPQADRLVEVDPDGGGVVGTWDLGGPVPAADAFGELLVFAGEEAVWVARSNDDRVQRVDRDTGTVETVRLPATREGDGDARMDRAWLDAEQGLLYVGGRAVDVDTLGRRAAADLPVSRILGRAPAFADDLVALDEEGLRVLRLGADGGTVSAVDWDVAGSSPTRLRLGARDVWIARGEDATVCRVPLGRFGR